MFLRFFAVILLVLLSSVFAFGTDVGPTVGDLLKRLETASPQELSTILQGLEASINRTDPAHLDAVYKRVAEIGRQKGIKGEQYAHEIFEKIDKVQWDQVDGILDRVANKHKNKLQAVVRTGSSGQRHLERARMGSVEDWEKPYKYLFSDDDVSFVGEAAEDAMKEFELALKQAGLKGRAKVKGFVLSSITETTNYELILKQLRDAESFVGSGLGIIKKEMLEKGGAVVYASEGGTLKTATQKIVDYVKTHSDSILAEVLNLSKIKAELKEFGPMTLFASVERILAEGNLQEREIIKQLWRVHVAMDLTGAYAESAGMLGAGGFSKAEMLRIGQILTDTVLGKRDIESLKSLLARVGYSIEDLRKRYFKLTLLNTSGKLWQIIDRIEKRCLASGEDVAQAIANSAEVRRFVHELAAGFDLLVKSKTYKLFSPEEFTELLRSANPESRNLFRVLWDAYFETQQLLTIERTAIRYAEAGNPKKIIENLAKTTDPKARVQVVEAAAARAEGTKRAQAIQEVKRMVQTPEGNKYLTMALVKDVGKKLMIAGIATGAAVMIKNQFDSWLAGKQVDLSDSAQSLIEIVPFSRGIWRIAVTEDVDKTTVFEFVKDGLYLTPLWWIALGADGIIIATEVGGALGTVHAQDIEQGLVDLLVYNGDFEERGGRYYLKSISLPSNQVTKVDSLVVAREDLEKFFFETKSVTVKISTPGLAQVINNLSAKSNEVLAKVYIPNDTTITAIHDATRKHLNGVNWAQLKDDIGEGKFWLVSNDFTNWLLGIDVLVERSQEKWAQVYRSIKGQVDKRVLELRTKYMIPNLIESAEVKKQSLNAENDLYEKLKDLQKELIEFRSDRQLWVYLPEEVKKRASEKGSENARADNETKKVTGGEYWQAAFKSYTWILHTMKQVQASISGKIGCTNFNQGHFEWSGDYEQDVLRATHSKAGYASDLGRIMGDVAKIKGSPGDLQDPTDRQAYSILCETVFPWRVALDSTNKAVKGQTYPENYHPDHQKGSKFYDDYAKALDRVKELYKKDADFQKLLEAGAEIKRSGNALTLEKGMPLELVLKSENLKKDYQDGRLTFTWISDPSGTFSPDAKNISTSFSPHIPLPATVWISVEKFGEKGEKLKGVLSVEFEVRVPEDFLTLSVDNGAVAKGGFGKAEAWVPDKFIAGPVKFSYSWSCKNCTLDRRAQSGLSTVGVQGPRDGSGTVTVTLTAEDKTSKVHFIASKNAVVSTAARFSARLDIYTTPQAPQKGDYLMFKALAVPTSSAPRPEGLRIDWYRGDKHLIQGDMYSFRAGSSGRYTLTAVLSFHDGKEQVILDRKTAVADVKEKPEDPKQEPLDDEDDVIIPPDSSVKDGKKFDDKKIDDKDGKKDDVKKEPPGCSYKYSEWGECVRATKKQTRRVIGKEPLGCVEKDKPALEQRCDPPPSEEDKRNSYLNCLCRCYCGWGGHIGVWYDPEEKTKPECKSSGPCIGGIGAFGCSSRHFFGAPNDCAKGCYEGVYGKGSYDQKNADKIRRDANKKFKEPLKLKLNHEKCPIHVQLGDVVNFTVSIEGGVPSHTVTWSGEGDAKDRNFTFIKTRQPGTHTVSATVTDSEEGTATISCSVIVDAVTVKIEKTAPKENTLPIGSRAHFKATVTSGANQLGGELKFRWQPHPEVLFEDNKKNPLFETTAPITSATYMKIGTFPMSVNVLKKMGEVYTTVGESDQIPLEIVNPKLKLTVDKKDPFIGETVVVTVQEEPKMSDDTLSFWWEIKGDAVSPGPVPNIPNSRAYSFKPKNNKPVTVTVHAKGKDGGDDLGSESITITAQSYNVTISQPRYLGPKPMIWKPQEWKSPEWKSPEWKEGKGLSGEGGLTPGGLTPGGGLVEVADTQFAVHHDIFMKATVTPSPESPRYRWAIDPSGSCGFPGAGDEIKLNCSNTGTYTAKVEVTNADGAKLGEATQSVTISISQETLDNSKKAKEAYDKLQKAKELVSQGKLDEGIPLAEEASKLDPKNTEAKNLSDKWKKDRDEIKQQITKLDQFLKDNKIAEAEKELQAAQKLHAKYQPVVDAEKRLKEAKDKAEKLKKEIAEKIEKAKELVAQGKLDEGIPLAEEALKLDPKHAEAKNLSDKWKKDRDEIKQQITKLDQFLKDNKIAEAEKELQAAQKLHAKYQPVVDAEKRLKEAKDKAEKLKKEIAEKLSKAKELVAQGKLDEGITLAEEASKLDPKNTEPQTLATKWKTEKQTVTQHVEKTKKLIEESKFTEAEKELSVAKNLHSKYPPVVETEKLLKDKLAEHTKKGKEVSEKLAKAKELAAQGKLDEAISLAEEAGKLDKNAATPVLNDLSGLSKKQGWDQVYNRNFKEALKLLEDAVRLNPSDQDAKSKLAQAKKFAGIWPQVEQKAKEFDQLISEKKVFSAQKKMLEMQGLQHEMTGGMANPLSKRVTDDFNKALQEYNEFRKGVEQKYTEYFKDKNWEEGLKLIEESLKRELHAADEKTDRARLAQCQQMLGGQRQVWEFYQRTKTEFDQGRIKDPSKTAQELRNKTSVYGDRAPQRQQMIELANTMEKKAVETQNNINAAQKLRAEGEAYQKQNRLNEAIAKYKESLKYVPDKALEDHIRKLEAKLAELEQKKVMAERLWQEGKALFDQNKPSEALAKFKESLKVWPNPERQKYVSDLESSIAQKKAQAQRLRQEGEALQNQRKLQDAVMKYRESLKFWPDPALEEHIRKIEVQIAKENENKAMADRLWQEGKGLFDQNKPSEALAKFKESLKYGSNAERQRYVKDLETKIMQTNALCQRLREEGQRAQNAGNLREALNKYRELQQHCPNDELVKHIAMVEAEIKKQQETQQKKDCAQRNQAEGAALQQQGRLQEAIAKYKESLVCWPNPQLESHIKQLQIKISSPVTTTQEPIKPVPVPVTIQDAQTINFLGKYKLTDPNRSTAQYHGDAILQKNDEGLVREYRDGSLIKPKYPETMKKEGYLPVRWHFDRDRKKFLFDWTLNGKLKGLGYFEGSISGDTNHFTLQGHWADGAAGQLRLERMEGYLQEGTQVSSGTTPSTDQGIKPTQNSMTITLKNVSRENVHIFQKGESFSPNNRITPGGSRKITITSPSNGWLEFCAGRNGQIISCEKKGIDPKDTSRVYTVIFDESNPYKKLLISTGLR